MKRGKRGHPWVVDSGWPGRGKTLANQKKRTVILSEARRMGLFFNCVRPERSRRALLLFPVIFDALEIRYPNGRLEGLFRHKDFCSASAPGKRGKILRLQLGNIPGKIDQPLACAQDDGFQKRCGSQVIRILLEWLASGHGYGWMLDHQPASRTECTGYLRGVLT